MSDLRGGIETPTEGVSDSGHTAPTGAAGVPPSSAAPTSACDCGSTETIELVRGEQAITICAGCGRDD